MINEFSRRRITRSIPAPGRNVSISGPIPPCRAHARTATVSYNDSINAHTGTAAHANAFIRSAVRRVGTFRKRVARIPKPSRPSAKSLGAASALFTIACLCRRLLLTAAPDGDQYQFRRQCQNRQQTIPCAGPAAGQCVPQRMATQRVARGRSIRARPRGCVDAGQVWDIGLHSSHSTQTHMCIQESQQK